MKRSSMLPLARNSEICFAARQPARLSRSAARRLPQLLAMLLVVSAGPACSTPAIAGDAVDFRRQRVVNQTLLRNTETELLLQRFAAHAAAGQHVEAVELYQDILDHEADAFVWQGNQIRPASEVAHREFAAHPELHAVYERLYGAAASQLLASQTSAAYREVARRFSQTEAGQSALERLIELAWDQGDLPAAGQLWQQMLYQPERAERLSVRRLQQIWVAGYVADNVELLQVVEQQPHWVDLPQQEIATVATLRHPESKKSEQSKRPVRKSINSVHWSTPRQQIAGSSTHYSPPLQEATWFQPREAFAQTAESPEDMSARLQTALEQWSRLQHEQLTPEVTTLFAVVVDDTLVYRDLSGVIAVKTSQTSNSGSTADRDDIKQPLWRYQTPSPLSQALLYEQDPYTGASTNHPGIDRLHLANSVSNALTTDGRRVFLVDGLMRHNVHVVRTVSHETESASTLSEEEYDAAPARLVNRLTALSLTAGQMTDDDSAIPAWQISVEGWTTGSGEPEAHDLSGHYFLGPPTMANGQAFVISEHDQYAYLSAVDAATGRCEWKLPISVVDRSIERDVVRATSACIAGYAQGLVLCDTGNGQLVAVDAHLGALRWTYGYADEDARQDSGRWTYTQSTRVTQPGVLNTPVVVGNRVLLLPERSNYLHCCDLKTGERLWTSKREGLEYLAAVKPVAGQGGDHGRVLGVGDRFCSALDVSDGSVVWNTATRCISGHGIQVGGQFLLPVSDPQRTLTTVDEESSIASATSGQILVLDLQTGERRGYSAIEGYTGDTSTKLSSEATGSHAFPLGNLLASDNMVFAVGVNQILGFPQAGAVIRDLKLASESRPLTETDYQQFARAELALGNLTEAKQYLRTAIKPRESDGLVREQSLTMYRELLYEELLGRSDSTVASRKQTILEELHGLAESPVQQVRYLTTELELGVQNGDLRDLPEVLHQLAEKGLTIPVNSTSEVGHVATSDSWMPGLYHQVCAQLSNTEQQMLLGELEQSWLNHLSDCSQQQLTTMLNSLSCPGRTADSEFDTEAGQCAADPYAYDLRPVEATLFVLRDMLQIELIHRAVAAKRWQEAELRLLRLKQSEDRIGRSYADQMLASLWNHLGLERQAVSCMEELSQANGIHDNYGTLAQWERYFESTGVNNDSRLIVFSGESQLFTAGVGLVEEDVLTHFSQENPYWNTFRQRQLDRGAVSTVSIRHSRMAESSFEDPYRRKRLLHLLPNEDWMVLQQLEKLPQTVAASESVNESDDDQHLLLLDRSSGSILHRIALPGSRISLSQATSKQAGHLLPVVVAGRILGVSLIEGRPLWERRADDLQTITPKDSSRWSADEQGIVRATPEATESRHIPRVELGPVGVNFCIAQTSRALVCLDPVDGRLLWRRSDLDPQGGLWSDREVGILGDEHAILYFHPDQNHYTLLDTRTGRALRRGALSNGSVQVQRTRQPFGRNLMFLSVSADRDRERRIRVWDPLTDEFLVDEPFGVSALYHHSEQDLAILADDQLRVYRPEEGRWLVNLDLSDRDLPRANYLRVSTLGDRYLVNLYQTRRSDEEEGYSSRYTDNPWDMTHLNGLVMAIDRRTGNLEWTRHLPHRSLVNAEHVGLPFLLTCANFQTQPGAPSRQLLLELIDPSNGETIARVDDLPSARLLLMKHDVDQQKLILSGLSDEIAISYQMEAVND